MDVYQLLYERRTITTFRPDVPDDAIILKAIDAARWAPNHHLTEPWRFYLIGEKTQAQIIDLNCRLVEEKKGAEAAQSKREKWSGIPGWLVVTVTRSEDPVQSKEDYASVSCAIHNLVLMLWDAGIGAKWTTGDVTRHEDFYDLIWVDPEHEDVVGLIWYGYPEAIPDGMRCKAVDEILVRLP